MKKAADQSLAAFFIYPIKEDGTDGGNLNVAANELTFKDLDDYSKSSERGFGVSISTGNPLGENNDHPEGETTISMVDKGHEIKGITHATIGKGDITLRDGTNPDELGINRDIENIQEITSDKVTGALDFEVTIDNRIFTEEGRKSIAREFTGLPENIERLAQAAKHVPIEKLRSMLDEMGVDKRIKENVLERVTDLQTHSGIVINPFDVIEDEPEIKTRVQDLLDSPSYAYVTGTITVGGAIGGILYGDVVTKILCWDLLISMVGTAVTGEEQKTVGSRAIAEITGLSDNDAETVYNIVGVAAGLASGLKGISKSSLTPGSRNSASISEIVEWYSPIKPGPLDSQIANTFRSGSYVEVVTKEPTILYRVWGGSAKEFGAYWTRTPPASPLASKMDSALINQWGNTAQNVVKIEIPAGTKLYEGIAASQKNVHQNLLGGGSQVVIPREVTINPDWIRK